MRRAPALLAALTALAGCPSQITETTFSRMSDTTPPVVDIVSPPEAVPYVQTQLLEGTAVDGGGALKSLAWTVTGTLGSLASGQVDLASLGQDGGFSFQFETLDFSGPIAVTVTAVDWNDNTAYATRTLAAPGSALSSFIVTPGNKSVVVDWVPVAGATYTLYYTTNGSVPSEAYGRQVAVASAPYEIQDLANGAMHVLLLRAQAGEDVYWSAYAKVIPLSPLTLAPEVTGEYRAIRLEWSGIPATGQFRVDRSLSPDGPWTDYTGSITGTSYTDVSVADGTWYYYRVAPDLPGSVSSTYGGARALELPPTSESAIVGTSLPGAARMVRVHGDFAFVAAEAAGLLVLDISDPAAPTRVSSLPSTAAQDLFLSPDGSLAFLADGTGGLRIVDISSPRNPSLLASVDMAAPYTEVVSVTAIETPDGDYAYVVSRNPADSRTAVAAIDVSVPSSPSLRASIYEGGGTYSFSDIAATHFTTGGSFRYLYVPSGATTNGELVKLHDTGSALAFVGAYYDDSVMPYNANAVWVLPTSTSADYVYALATARYTLEPPPDYAVRVFGQTTPVPAVVGTSPTARGAVRDLVLSGTTVYAADGRGLQIVDVSTPSSPVLGPFWNTPGTPLGVDVGAGGTHAVVASSTLGLHTVHLTQPLSFTLDAKHAAASASGVAVRGPFAYLTQGGAGARLQVLDLTNPTSPAVRGHLPMVGAGDVVLVGRYAFVADGSSGLRVADVTDPDAIRGLSVTPPVSYLTGRLVVRGDYAYLAGGGLHIYDVSDPAHPFAVGYIDSDGGGIQDVAIRGDRLYIVDGAYFQPNSLKVIDISIPSAPRVLSSGGAPTLMVDSVALGGEYAFVTDGMFGTGLWAVNIHAPSSAYMSPYGSCDTTLGATDGWSTAVAVYGNWAFVGDTTSGLAVVDVSSPRTLDDGALRVNTSFGGALASPREVMLSGRHLFVTDSHGTTGGLVIARIGD